MYRYFLNNPCGKNVGDCVIRAISKVMDISWYKAFKELCNLGMMLCDLPNSNYVWSNYLRRNGFVRHTIDNCTVREFSDEYPYGTYVLSTGSHLAACIDGTYFDAWDSGQEIIESYWRKEIQ